MNQNEIILQQARIIEDLSKRIEYLTNQYQEAQRLNILHQTTINALNKTLSELRKSQHASQDEDDFYFRKKIKSEELKREEGCYCSCSKFRSDLECQCDCHENDFGQNNDSEDESENDDQENDDDDDESEMSTDRDDYFCTDD